MKDVSISLARRSVLACAVAALVTSPVLLPAHAGGLPTDVEQLTFATPEEAAKALVDAARSFNTEALTQILGPDGVDLVVTEDEVANKNQMRDFAEKAGEKMSIAHDTADPKQATMVLGAEDWPAPIPLQESNGRWAFDTGTGREEILARRIGRNELDAIEICEGYVEAQMEYASTTHDDAMIPQYAQRILSTPGKHDGLAWQDPDGTWAGPVGEGIARVIAEGYKDRFTPYHGYYFKVLKEQGPAAPMGTLNYVVKGAMIGGFALAAAPADYGVTGVKSFIVGPDGVVYEKDLGSKTSSHFRALKAYDPDSSWKPVAEP